MLKKVHVQRSTAVRRAAALGYDPARNQAPVILANGAGHTADQILRLARENQVPIREDNALMDALAALNVGDEIPPELYRVVAAVLAYVYRIKGKRTAVDTHSVADARAASETRPAKETLSMLRLPPGRTRTAGN